MPFRPGEKPVQPAAPGRSKGMARAMTNLALAVRNMISTDMMTRWHALIASGKAPLAIITTHADGSWEVTDVQPEPNGFAPTLDQRNESMKWFNDRGHGQAPQIIHLDAQLKSQINLGPTIPVRDLAPSAALAIAGLLRQRQQSQKILDVPMADELQLDERESEPALESEVASAEPDGDAEG